MDIVEMITYAKVDTHAILRQTAFVRAQLIRALASRIFGRRAPVVAATASHPDVV